MKRMLIIPVMLIIFSLNTYSQNKPNGKTSGILVGGGCDGCEAIYDGMPSEQFMDWIDTLPDFHEPGPKMEVSGTIFLHDGKTPASNVILYIYHTDQTGHYTPKPGQTGAGRRNGYIRGWIKTGDDGKYKFLTLKPAAYPSNNIPAHIHPIIKEPRFNEYYIDEYVFSDDQFVNNQFRQKRENRGGSGIVTLTLKPGGMLECKRDIILGKNIPGYPSN